MYVTQPSPRLDRGFGELCGEGGMCIPVSTGNQQLLCMCLLGTKNARKFGGKGERQGRPGEPVFIERQNPLDPHDARRHAVAHPVLEPVAATADNGGNGRRISDAQKGA